MTKERILELIAAYGADVSAFPEADRDVAREMLARQPGLFADALREAGSLDRMLADLPAIDTPANLRAALIAGAPAPQTTKRMSRWRLPVWMPAGAFASLAVGLFAGMSFAQPAVTQDDTAEELVYAALGFDEYTFSVNEDVTQ